MSEIISRQNSLNHLLAAGDFFAADKDPGVMIEPRCNIIQFQLIAHHGKTTQLAQALAEFLNVETRLAPRHGATHNGLSIYATGPLEYWLLAETVGASQANTASQTLKDLLNIAGQWASVFDQSAGRSMIRLTGRNAADILAKGTSLDLHVQAFPALGAAHTVIEHIPALITRRSDPLCYDISFPRGYAASFSHWLREAAQQYGYVILAPKI